MNCVVNFIKLRVRVSDEWSRVDRVRWVDSEKKINFSRQFIAAAFASLPRITYVRSLMGYLRAKGLPYPSTGNEETMATVEDTRRNTCEELRDHRGLFKSLGMTGSRIRIESEAGNRIECEIKFGAMKFEIHQRGILVRTVASEEDDDPSAIISHIAVSFVTSLPLLKRDSQPPFHFRRRLWILRLHASLQLLITVIH
ncbi:hypothetical protein EVAR_27538_1 [Eumeta japonica]|uniref:Uncharacterized protein n=1 Tax=Eumeta variegata TaxID=151549 RepID=A0A4C1W4L9_EUMVA|nr:hypothetical protein EVAR_27538_1 [Eumeta japonica]